MNKVIIVGCGLQAYGMSLDCAKFAKPKEMSLLDVSPSQVNALRDFLKKNVPDQKVTTTVLLGKGISEWEQHFKGADLILNGAPYRFATDLTKAAILAKVPMVDLGGDTDQVLAQLELSGDAKTAGITIVPDCGMGPGMTNITVGHAMEILDEAETIITRDGGIPTNGKAPLFYHLVFAIETLTNEYTEMTTQMRNGKRVNIAPMEEIERITLPVVGDVEATHGMGMLSTLPWTYEGRIQNLENKFVRYPGHLQIWKNLRDLGFFSRETLMTEKGPFEPRAMTKAILEKYLTPKGGEKDVSFIQTVSVGKKNGKRVELTHFICDHSDPVTGLTSMQRTTGFTASIVGQMIAQGKILEKGVIPPELAVPKKLFFDEIQKRGFQFQYSEKEIG